MSVGAWIAAAVGVLALLGAVGRLLWAIHKGVNLIVDTREDVAALHKVLNNGIRADVQSARDEAKKAQVLAADAARAASVADQHAEEGRVEIQRAVNHLRAEVDVYTNVVLSDRQRIRAAWRDAGYVLDDDEA